MSMDARSTDGSRPIRPAAGLFRNRGFMLLWAAYGVSAMGDHISEMALLKSQGALDSPHLTQLQAMITFMFMLPFFVLGPFNGILADRLPRRGIMIFANLVRAALMFNFAALVMWCGSRGQTWAFVPLLVVGVFAAVFSPARAALLPSLIREDQIIRANAMSSGLGVIATMIAAVIGGYLAKYYEPSVSFHIDAGTFLVSALLLSLIRTPPAETVRHRGDAGWSALTEGVRYLRQHRRIVQLVLVAVVVWSCGALVWSTIPTLVRDIFKEPDYLVMSGFQVRLGLGMLLGAGILTVLGDALRGEIAVTWSLGGLGLSIGILTFSAMARIPAGLAYHVGGVAIILAGVFATGVMASYSALLQRIVPNRLRGRMFGLTDLATMAGLLLVTGLLGIPRWPNIDRWVGWILLLVTLIVLGSAITSLLVRLKTRTDPRWVTFWRNANEFYCKWWFRLKRVGPLTVPAEGPVLVVCNHTCSIDPLLVIALIRYRTVGFMVAREYYDIPLFGRLIKMVDCVPVNRDGQDTAGTKAALRHLKSGKPLGIFIEGRIPGPGEAVELKDGAAMLALKTGAVVVPVRITGTRYSPGALAPFFRRHNARVYFGKPMNLDSFRQSRPDREVYRRLTEQMKQAIDSLGTQGEAN